MDRIINREMANYRSFEYRLQAGINRWRASQGLPPFNSRNCLFPGSPDEEIARNQLHRGERIRVRIQQAAEEWVRQHPTNSRWDRFVRWIRGDDDDGPPSSGGNLATDFGLEDVDLHGSTEERAGSAGLRGHQRDGMLSEDPADPDNLPNGPHILIVPPAGVPLPSVPIPEAIPFRLPVLEPLLIHNDRQRPTNRDSANCSCQARSSVRPASIARRLPLHIGSAGSPVDISDSGSEPSGSERPSSNPPEATPPSPDSAPADLTGDFSDIAWTRFRLQRSDNPWQNCYTVESNTTRDGQIKQLRGIAKIYSDNRGASWNFRYWVEIKVEREDRDPLTPQQRTVIDASGSHVGSFDGDGRSVMSSDKSLTGSISLINPRQNPSVQTIPLDSSAFPELPGTEIRIETTPTKFRITVTAPGISPLRAVLPKHRTTG